jgi:hypothetical protein
LGYNWPEDELGLSRHRRNPMWLITALFFAIVFTIVFLVR